MTRVNQAWAQTLLEAERERARARLRAFTDEHTGIVESSIDANSDDEHDPEGATIAFERARVGTLRAETAAYLDALQRALGRLDAGGYGVCAGCGADISPERLEARPATETCVACAAVPRRA